jgi:uncharacterized protein YbjT (DUF2867 family)
MSTTKPILVTGAAGKVGGVGRTVCEMLLERGFEVRAMVRREDDRSAALARMGATLVVGDLRDLGSVHQAIEGCGRVYFGMSVSPAYLEATVNIAAVAKHHGVEAFVNMSQMTVSQMSIHETTPSPQQKLHWLSEQVLSWSGLPVVHVRPTAFLDAFFLLFSAKSVRERSRIALPFGSGKTSPIAAYDVARVVAEILANPAPHIGAIYELTGPRSQDMTAIAKEYSAALGREITYENVPWAPWKQGMLDAGIEMHVVDHLSTMALLNQDNRYDRFTNDVEKVTGQPPMSVREFVSRHSEAFGGMSRERVDGANRQHD